jgi:hypothetical protein
LSLCHIAQPIREIPEVPPHEKYTIDPFDPPNAPASPLKIHKQIANAAHHYPDNPTKTAQRNRPTKQEYLLPMLDIMVHDP